MNKRGAYQKKARNLKNVEARHALLVASLKSPERVSESVAKTMEGQRAFCSLTLPGSDIEPLSLNTLKSLAGELYSTYEDAAGDGFRYFDGLRSRLKTLLENTPRGRSVQAKATRQLEHQKSLVDQLHAVELHNARRSKAYLDLFGKINTFIREATIEEETRLRLFKILKSHQELYGSLFRPQGEKSRSESAVLIAWPSNRES